MFSEESYVEFRRILSIIDLGRGLLTGRSIVCDREAEEDGGFVVVDVVGEEGEG